MDVEVQVEVGDCLFGGVEGCVNGMRVMPGSVRPEGKGKIGGRSADQAVGIPSGCRTGAVRVFILARLVSTEQLTRWDMTPWSRSAVRRLFPFSSAGLSRLCAHLAGNISILDLHGTKPRRQRPDKTHPLPPACLPALNPRTPRGQAIPTASS